MVKKEIRIIIEAAAKKYGLDPDLIEAFVMQESGGDPLAVRMETKFYEKYTKPMSFSDTEEICRAMSWGLMQIMGEVARELGYNDKWLTGLLDKTTGIEWGCKCLKSKLTRYKGVLLDAIAAYNAGSAMKVPGTSRYVNQVYVDGVQKYLSTIKKEVRS